ncbi:MAG TPA: sulfur transferase domain-containing protein [Candidatus Polarisedimenticolia bacterium]|nr:sulfur transferase domain-containing protein [Candidatus Polarisedimenticolia bacterium]
MIGLGAASALEPTPSVDPAVKKSEAPGIKNYSLLEGSRGYGGARFGFGGATEPSAMAFLKKQGFASVINLRAATEEGADVEAGRAAALQAKLAYFHIPFDPAHPDPDVVEKFLAVLGAPANQPVFIHCKSGNRVGSLWMIKRVLKDGWTIDKAREEAVAIGLATPQAEKFALDTIAPVPTVRK